MSNVYPGPLTDELLADTVCVVRSQAAGLPCDDLIWAELAFLLELQERRAAGQPSPARGPYKCAYCAVALDRFQDENGKWWHELDDESRVECATDNQDAGQAK